MLTNRDKKEWAKLLFLKTDMTQDEIATKVGVQRKTIWQWKEKEKWDILKGNFIITKEQELRRIYFQINELNTSIEQRDEGKRFATSKEADILSKLSAAAKQLESETSIAEIVDVFVAFSTWLSEIDFEKARDWVSIQDAFIKDRLKKY